MSTADRFAASRARQVARFGTPATVRRSDSETLTVNVIREPYQDAPLGAAAQGAGTNPLSKNRWWLYSVDEIRPSDEVTVSGIGHRVLKVMLMITGDVTWGYDTLAQEK